LARHGDDPDADRDRRRGQFEEEVPLTKWVRQVHRWVSVAFMLAAVVNIIAMGGEKPALWVGLLALVPLAFLLLTGLYLFVQPYAARWRAPRLSGHVSA
jgi:hypothetical protein